MTRSLSVLAVLFVGLVFAPLSVNAGELEVVDDSVEDVLVWLGLKSDSSSGGSSADVVVDDGSSGSVGSLLHQPLAQGDPLDCEIERYAECDLDHHEGGGGGTRPDGPSPVPEPLTMLLFSMGGGAALLARRRRS